MKEKISQAEERLEGLRMRHLIEQGERLREERKRLGYSLLEFAKLLGIHRNTQGNYEAGREPPSSYLLAAQEVGVDIAYVIDGERLRGIASHCARSMEEIFTKARDYGLSSLHPAALAHLAFLMAKNEEWLSSGFSGGMEDAQISSLFEAAFRTPDEFDEAAIAISKYGSHATGKNPSPMEEAAMIIDTLSIYAENRDRLHLSLRDNIRMVAEDVAKSAVTQRDSQ